MKNLIKGIILMALVAILSCCCTVMADDADSSQTKTNVGDVIGHIYETDIVADIDGMKIPSYNIGGETVVIVEDLANYGFDVIWDGQKRTLSVYTKEKPAVAPDYVPQNGKISGAVAGDIYYSDITINVNGFDVIVRENGLVLTSYNIGGKTAISIEYLSCANKPEGIDYRITYGAPYSPWGYSSYMFKSF